MPSCFAVWRFPPTFRMCKQALGHFLFAVLLVLRFLRVPVPSTAWCTSAAAPALCGPSPCLGSAAYSRTTNGQLLETALPPRKWCIVYKICWSAPIYHLHPFTCQVGNKDPTQMD